MAKSEVEVITSERRRRHWSRAEKERIVAAALEPGATILGVARAPSEFMAARCFAGVDLAPGA
ncbi:MULTISPECIES: transposase [unclassified Bradyrhizobium]|uniref:transposase n=1 Tax=unclassified Bradyrhizobium TaxID=2631580 RepID=UPI002916301B|nr:MULTISPECIES: transposase [unclassified Bradyrhizobium]